MARYLRRVAFVARANAACAFKRRLEHLATDLDRRRVIDTLDGKTIPEFALGVRAVDDHEIAPEVLTISVFGTCQPAIFPSAARAYSHLHGADRAVGDDIERLLLTIAVKVEVEVAIGHDTCSVCLLVSLLSN